MGVYYLLAEYIDKITSDIIEWKGETLLNESIKNTN
jgi:hypothetical protein